MRVSLIALAGGLAVLAQATDGSAQGRAIADQIREAVFILAEADRDGAAVMGYTQADTLEVIRHGTNGFICLADQPGDDRYQASCYDKALDPFMARGRALRSQGKGGMEVRAIRRAEVEAGTLAIPDSARLVSHFGSIDPETGRPDSVSVLRVIYVPFATEASTGMSSSAERGRPFLMDAGQHRAHLMIPSGRIAFRP